MQWFMIHDALFEHAVQGHHWLVAGLESVSLPQVVQTPGVTLLLELEDWVVAIGRLSDLILYCCLFVVLKGWSLMSASGLQYVQDLWLLVCLWSVHW